MRKRKDAVNMMDEPKSKTFDTIKEGTTVSTLLFYIIYGVVDNFGNNAKLYWIPFILFFINFLILLYFVLRMVISDRGQTKSTKRRLIFNLTINLIAALLSGYALGN